MLDCYPYTTNELLTALRLHVYVTHLSLASCSLITDRGLQPLIGKTSHSNNNLIYGTRNKKDVDITNIKKIEML